MFWSGDACRSTVRRQPRRHQRRGDAVARTHRSENSPIRRRRSGRTRPDRRRHGPRAATAGSPRPARNCAAGRAPAIAAASRLDQVAVERIIEFPQFLERGVGPAGCAAPIRAPCRGCARPPLTRARSSSRITGLARKSSAPASSPPAISSFSALRGQQDEIAYSALAGWRGTPDRAPARHARHHPVGDHDVNGLRGAEQQRLDPAYAASIS